MNTKQIETALTNVLTVKGSLPIGFKEYCSRATKLPALIKELKKLDGFSYKFSPAGIQEIAHLTINRSVSYDGVMVECEKLTIKHSFGEYVFNIPADNEWCDFIHLQFDANYKAKNRHENGGKPLFGAIVSPEAINKLKTAAKFVSKDKLRPALNYVNLKVVGEIMTISATECHYLFTTNLPCENICGDFEISVSVDAIKNLPKKPIEAGVIISVFEKTACIYQEISGEKSGLVSFGLPELLYSKFPDCSMLFTETNEVMEFEKTKLLSALKCVTPMACKVTNKVKFHLNGSISMAAFDADFENEAKAEIQYISKNFADTDIDFNHKFVANLLNCIDAENVKMHKTEGQHVIFSGNSADKFLLMPLVF